MMKSRVFHASRAFLISLLCALFVPPLTAGESVSQITLSQFKDCVRDAHGSPPRVRSSSSCSLQRSSYPIVTTPISARCWSRLADLSRVFVRRLVE